ncbi:MAG: hypothetical protein R2737_09820 [Candidatus Nanopelagicales bacterium]
MSGSATPVTCPSCGASSFYTVDSEPDAGDARVTWYRDEHDYVMQRREDLDGEVLELRRVTGDLFCSLCHAYVAGPAVARRVIDLTEAAPVHADLSTTDAAVARAV